ncbi:RNA-binding protein [Pseudohoeflea coraliihabitans]|uniref:RNA-binding protein n=1 Tax=Pseudohoeflea coraliihabitans TaxID=2860393 RepID=A0ABS6WP14_9HYPH|nr:RNA-binding protein [Pseudohoeflea sp. DP4N28-3]MBW3097645.1 RNA-binding protein [Pseudohoeflea sp. DP4N28-3]
MCILTRARGDSADLIRFVGGPDGTVIPDLRQRLPGRGCWLRADRAAVETAVRKNLFARALKTAVTPPQDLGDRIDALLLADLAGMMGLARKSGQFVSGASKADAAIRSGDAIGLFHAAHAAADGVRKLAQAIKARALTLDEPEIPVFRLLAREEMERALGDGAFIHATALAGQAGEGVVKRAKRLVDFRATAPVQAQIETPGLSGGNAGSGSNGAGKGYGRKGRAAAGAADVPPAED